MPAAATSKPLRKLARVQQQVVDALATAGEAQVAEIEHRWGIPRSSITAALRTLWREGLVQRHGDRIFQWYLTPYGRRHITRTKAHR